MLEDLSKAREKTIEELTKELDEINARKEERGNGEEELASIASAYDVLFAEERAKHEELKKQLLQRHDETQDILKERKNALDVLDSGYEEEKRSLLKSFDDQEKELTDESEEAERQLEEEKKTLEEKRASLSDTIRSLRERYRQIDKEIENEKLSLRNSYRDKVHEISKLYQNALEEQRTRLSRYDVMNDADNDLFKSDGD